MEITKLRSQLFIVLEQASATLERARNTLGRLGTGVSDTLQEARRSSESAWRKLEASFLAAVVFTNGKITKFRPQLAMASERAAAHVQSAQSALAKLGTGIAETLQKALRSTESAWRKLEASFLAAVVFTNGKISKLRPQLSIASERVAAQLQSAQGALARAGTGTADGLLEALRSTHNALRRLRASFLAAVVFTNGKTAKLRPQLAMASERAAAQVRSAQSALAKLGTGIANTLRHALRSTENALRKLCVGFLEAIFAIKRAIRNCGSKLFAALKQVAAPFQNSYGALARVVRSAIDRPRRLEEARLARENDLQTLLASSADAVIVTNSDRRLVAANSQALDIFGVSELNMSNFTIGTFLSQRQIRDFDRNCSPFVGGDERHGKCKIRRLDGSVWVAECIFVANFVPRRNLYRFVNVAPQKITQWRSPARYTENTGKPFEAQSQHHKAS